MRQRREDIPLLATYFVQKIARQMQKKIDSVPASVMKGLMAWDWPGNIRELENFIERAVILTRGKTLNPGPRPAQVGSLVARLQPPPASFGTSRSHTG